MDELALAEFRALRHSIASRGTLRPLLLVVGLGLWGAVLISVLVLLPTPITAGIPLLLLLATFEGLRALHTSVERIGRYLQAYFEEKNAAESAGIGAPPAWEQTAMRLSSRVPGVAGHPLFLPVFLIATLVNLLAVWLPGPVPVELFVMGFAHVAFVAWLLYVDRGVRTQRADDLERFRQLRRT